MKKLVLVFVLISTMCASVAFGQNFSMKAKQLPKKVNVNQDISKFSYEELRILKNYVFASHGYWFRNPELLAFFKSKLPGYEELCWEMCEKVGEDRINSNIKVSAAEQAFVAKIQKRMDELKQSKPFITSNGMQMLNPDLAVNMFMLDEKSDKLMSLLRTNNFAISHSDCDQLFNIYEQNDYNQMPNYVTPDLYLQAFHMMFEYVLRTVEEKEYVPMLGTATKAMYDEAIKLGNNHVATFFAIAENLLMDKKESVPDEYKSVYDKEIANISTCRDNASPFMNLDSYPYSLFKPRGHYTRTEGLKKYFRGMMWLQTASFCVDSKEDMTNATAMALAFNNISAAEQAKFKKVYESLRFLMGEPDNFSILEIADYLKSNGMDAKTALSKSGLKKVQTFVEAEIAKGRNKIAPKIKLTCADKINFMPQRYMIDSEILQEMVDVNLNADRAYPKGVDVFAVLGNPLAEKISNKDAAIWGEYNKAYAEMTRKFRNFDDWNKTAYYKILECLVSLQKQVPNVPNMMKTEAYQTKNLNTALAGWAQLKHSAVLYAKQPMAAECGGGGLPDPIVKGYIEPCLPFWNKLKETVNTLRNMLKDNSIYLDEMTEKFERIEDGIDFCIQISEKELNGKKLDEVDFGQIRSIGSSVEYLTLSLVGQEGASSWEDIQGPDKNIAIATDVYTRNIPGDEKNGILHEAVGKPNVIYAIVKIDGEYYLTRGAVLGYYEFIRPLNERLTDEEWQKVIEENIAPHIIDWMQPLMFGKEPKVDEWIFYSSGC